MDSHIGKQMIEVIRSERQRLADQLTILDREDHDNAWEEWLFTVEPFINDMCLMVLVALRHQIERELVLVAARVNSGATIDIRQYRQNVKLQRDQLKKKDGWKNLIATLNLDSFTEWAHSMKTLQLLSNCLKHEPMQGPDDDLLRHLNLPLKPIGPMIVGYLPLAESSCFREGLAASMDLPTDTDYCAIVDAFVDATNQFLVKVREHSSLAKISGMVSLVEFAC